jgi:hypothetical protein
MPLLDFIQKKMKGFSKLHVQDTKKGKKENHENYTRDSSIDQYSRMELRLCSKNN